MPTANEKILKIGQEMLRCLCGNNGFVPCNRLGQEVEEIEGIWDGYRYVCLRCGRIVNGHTLDVIGMKEASPLTDQ